MKKRALSILFLIIYALLAVLSLASCGGSGNVRGVELSCYVSDFTYDYENDVTTYIEVSVSAYNANNSSAVKNFKYKLTFLDSNSNVLTTKQLAYYQPLEANDSVSFYQTFSSQQFGSIKGSVQRVVITPIEMTLGEGTSNNGGGTEWSFWTYFWVIISGILVLLFVFCCIGAEGDSDTIIGGVVIFLAPAIIILSVYFGFFFGH